MLFLIGLYIITLIVFIALYFGLEKVTRLAVDTDESEETDDDLGEMWWKFLLQIVLYIAAILSFAVLPAISKGGVLYASVAALILSVTVELVATVSNYAFVKFMGAINWLIDISVRVMIIVITAVAAYYVALLLI